VILEGWSADDVPAVLGPVAGPPPRRASSVRRTSSLVMSWPDGLRGGMHLEGRCRDLHTPADPAAGAEPGPPVVLADERIRVTASMSRTIEAIETTPDTPRIGELAGVRAGGGLRKALNDVVPDLRDDGRPRYLLLDDLGGATLIAGFVFFRWRDHIPGLAEATSLRQKDGPMRSMAGVCSGFRPGASSLGDDGAHSGVVPATAVVPPIADPDDPDGWHEMPSPDGMTMRRARRIDVWWEPGGPGSDAGGHGGTGGGPGRLRIDAMFRDSCWDPDGTEVAAHEYHLDAAADAATGELTWVEAQPRVLPYVECPIAAANVDRMEGVPLADLRTEVLARLQLIDCCTHLNDALRALAEVPVLAAALPDPAGGTDPAGGSVPA
jgi:hypothetical protein